MAKPQDLFAPTNFTDTSGLQSNALFSPPSSAAPATSVAERAVSRAQKPLSKTEQKAADEAAMAAKVDQFRQQLISMRNSPAWTGASLAKRKDLYAKWREQKWKPLVESIQDRDLQKQLNRLPTEVLESDYRALEKSIGETSFWDDTWKRTKAATAAVAKGFANDAPAAASLAREKALQERLNSDTTLSPQERIRLTREMHEARADRQAYTQSAKEKQEYIDEQRNATSIGQSNRERELAEDIEENGGFAGTLQNPATGLLQAGVENAVPLAAGLGATALGTVVAGPAGGLAAGSVVGSALGAEGTMSTAVDMVHQLPQEQLEKLEPYQKLLAKGTPPDEARDILALEAGSDAALAGAVIGFVQGLAGAVPGAGKAIGSALTGGLAKSTGRKAVGDFALQLGVDTAAGAGQQIAANVAVNDNVGTNIDTFDKAGEAAAMGLYGSLPVAAPTAVAHYRAGRNAGDANTTTPTPEDGSGTLATESDFTGGDNEATRQAAPEQPTPETAPPSTDADIEALLNARSAVDEARAKDGTAFEPAERDALVARLLDAEANGADAESINALADSVNRAMPFGEQGTLVAHLDAARAQRDAQAATEPAQAVTPEQEPTNAAEPDTGASGSDTPTVSEINRAMEAPTTDGEQLTTEVPGAIEQTGTVVEDAGVSRAGSDADAAQGGTEEAATGLGGAVEQPTTVSRPDNQPVSTSGEAVSAGERDVAGAAGQRAADGGSADSTEVSKTRRNPSVGDTVTYEVPMFGNHFTGIVTAVDPSRATFNLRTESGGVYERIPIANIRDEPMTDAFGDTALQAEMSREDNADAFAQMQQAIAEGRMTAEQAERVTKNAMRAVKRTNDRSAAGDYITEFLNHLLDGTTPYTPERITETATRIENTSPAYSDVAAEMNAALERGDAVRAEELAQYSYEHGLREFTPAQENTGTGAEAVEQSMLRTLTTEEQAALSAEFDRMMPDMPPELSTEAAARDAAIQDALLTDGGNPPLTDILSRMTERGREIIRKLAKAVAGVVIALTINQMTPVHDAVAATGYGNVTHVTHVEGLSQGANTVNSWVKQTKDNAGRPYIIADKVAGEIHIVAADGKVLATSPALYGKKLGDGMSLGETPAGIFSVHHEAAPKSYGGDAQDFATAPGGDVYAIHRVLTTNPKEQRVKRLASADAKDHRVSLGCINVPADLYNKYLAKNFNGKLYVMPDQKNLGEVFQGIREQEAQQDLMPGETLPQDMSNPTNTQFQSSTENVARADTTGETGADVTTYASQSVDPEIATSPVAAVSNVPADTAMYGAALLPLFGAARARKRAKERGRGGQATDDDAVSNPTRDLTDAQYSRVVGADDDNVANGVRTSVAQQPRSRATMIMQKVQRAAAYVADTGTSMLTWLDEAVGRGANEDTDVYGVYRNQRLLPGKQANAETHLYEKFIKPMDDLARTVAERTGKDVEQTMRNFGSWLTMRHIPEANAAIRKDILAEYRKVITTGTPEEIARAKSWLAAFDDAQAGKISSKDLKSATAYTRGDGSFVPGYGLAGNITDAHARRMMQHIEAWLDSPEDLVALGRLSKEATDGMLDYRVANGTMSAEEAAQLRGAFDYYVPLYVTDEPGAAGGDIYSGTNMYNPAGDHVRRGSSRTADHAFIALRKQMFRTAAGVAATDFKRSVHDLYETRRPEGLERVNTKSQGISQEARDAKGLYYREGDKTYKYYWTDPKVLDGLIRQHAEPEWKTVGLLRSYTALRGKLYTVGNPAFWVVNYARDVGSRSVTSIARNLTDADGNVISPTRAALAINASLANPAAVAALSRYAHTGRGDSVYVRELQRLRELGGVSSFTDQIRKGVKDYRAEARQGKYGKKMDAVMDRVYDSHEALSMAPAVQQFRALKKLGVPEEKAAFIVRDDFDATLKSAYHQQASTLFPFIASSANSAKNVVGRLATPRGAKVFSSLVLAGLAAYSMVSALNGPNDEGGDWMDDIPLSELAGYIPFRTSNGGIYKAPMPFELPRIAWTMASGLHRLGRGEATPSEFWRGMSHTILREVQPFGLEKVGEGDSWMKDLMLAATPEAFKPFAELGLNQTGLGGRIHSDSARGVANSASGQARTADVWKNTAAALKEYTGIDMFPESVKHLANSFLPGALGAIAVGMEQDSLYMASGELTTRQELGIFGTALGLGSVWDNGNRHIVNNYYTNQDKVTKLLDKYSVPWGDANSGNRDAAAAIYDRMIDAGASYNEAELVSAAKDADRQLAKAKSTLNKAVKENKSFGLNPESAAPDFDIFNEDRRNIMEEFNREYRRYK